MPWILSRLDPAPKKTSRKGPKPKPIRVAIIICDACGERAEVSPSRWRKWGLFPAGNVYCGRTCSGRSKIAAASVLAMQHRSGAKGYAVWLQNLNESRWDYESRRVAQHRMRAMRAAAPTEWNAKLSAAQQALFSDDARGPKRRAQISAINSRPDIKRKKRETMRLRNSFRRSCDEDRMAIHLGFLFGGNVRRTVELNGWEIDFYLPSVDVYLQLDGAYWHGLDRPISVLRAATSVRDKTIAATFDRDVAQAEWCRERGIRLARVTDRQLRKAEKAGNVNEWILNTLKGNRAQT